MTLKDPTHNTGLWRVYEGLQKVEKLTWNWSGGGQIITEGTISWWGTKSSWGMKVASH